MTANRHNTAKITFLDEAQIEAELIRIFKDLGYNYANGPDIAHDGISPERADYSEVLLIRRLRKALGRLNPNLPPAALEEALRKVMLTESPSLLENNRRNHQWLLDGVPVEYRKKDGPIQHDNARLMDWDNIANNEFLAVNQFTVIEGNQNRRADVVLFINGLPLVVVELKNPADANATIKRAFRQLQTYQRQISSLFAFSELLVISDGLSARAGTLTADWERFMPWRTIDGTGLAPDSLPQMDVLARGMFEPGRLLDLIRFFTVFEKNGVNVSKKIAGYHQYYAVNKAVDCTLRATAPAGDRRIGVVWHTQGSGKSLSMAFYTGKIIQQSAMANPTVIILTDRNDLDDQLFGTFSRCCDLLRQNPAQAQDRTHLRQLLTVASGGVVFTTIQKFLPENRGDTFPLLSDRRNIVVIADEAHRSQYDFIDGFARHMRDALPNASFIGFTGTPIEGTDKSTPAVFGDYIDIYDIQRAVDDGATVPIYYEARLAKISLSETEKPKIDAAFEEVTEGEEESARRAAKSRWAKVEALVGTPKRIGLVAEDIVRHFQERLSAIDGKAMVVCMSRRICVELYDALIRLRPDWHSDDDGKGAIKIVMTGSASDPLGWQQHIRNKPRRESLAERFKNPKDPLKVIIVRDMWLTGFDAPCLHTMYLDKPMRGHGLMQAIARVNRVFGDKPGGLVVDYLGLADQLKKALAAYTEGGGRGDAAVDQTEAVAVMRQKFAAVSKMFDGFDYEAVLNGPASRRMAGIAQAMEHILQLEDGKKRYLQAVTELSQAFALSVPDDEALRIRDKVGFFQAVRAGLTKALEAAGGKTGEDIDLAIRQIVSQAVISDQVIDIFAAAGLKSPDISILSDDFLREVRDLPQRHLAVELLQKLINDEIKARLRRNVVQGRSFAEMLEESIRRYQNRSIEAAQVISELIELARQMRAAQNRGQQLGLTEDEVAFYDALEVNDSAVKVLGEPTLKSIARELVESVRKNATIDWTVRESARAGIRVIIKRILKKYGYPPDKQESATALVMQQAEVICGAPLP
ncbi:MAG: type I restriction endonuclease subunit R [Phycisphaerales bacterium]|nr:type I restriction endonuclease subunit R [Phycisphaerales bacterium]